MQTSIFCLRALVDVQDVANAGQYLGTKEIDDPYVFGGRRVALRAVPALHQAAFYALPEEARRAAWGMRGDAASYEVVELAVVS